MNKYLGSALALVILSVAGSPVLAAAHVLHYLSADEIRPALVLPAPPAPGSIQEKGELAELHAMIAAAPPTRLDQARWDDQHETPALFDRTLGLELEKYPLTWALLREVQEEGDAAASVAKAYFQRTRPRGVDATIPICVKTGKPAKSYPSGHATLGYSTGFVLAHLLGGRSAAILDRAADYATSRELCGVHFPTDLEASHALGTLVASKLMAIPAFRAKFDAARQELVAARVAGVAPVPARSS